MAASLLVPAELFTTSARHRPPWLERREGDVQTHPPYDTVMRTCDHAHEAEDSSRGTLSRVLSSEWLYERLHERFDKVTAVRVELLPRQRFSGVIG